MPWIIACSLKFRMAVVVAAVAISAIGITQLRSAPVDVLPEASHTTGEPFSLPTGLRAAVEALEGALTIPRR